MTRSLALAALVFSSSVFAASPTTFRFDDPNNRNTVTFVLEAPLETINGLSNHVNGQVSLSESKASGEFRVPVKELKTGNSTRDGHLAGENWLDAAKYPNVVVTFSDLAVPALTPGQTVKLNTKVKFAIHGVTREEPVELSATLLKESEETKNRLPGDLLHLKARFKIPLEAYNIKRTRALLLKVGESADVALDVWGSTKS